MKNIIFSLIVAMFVLGLSACSDDSNSGSSASLPSTGYYVQSEVYIDGEVVPENEYVPDYICINGGERQFLRKEYNKRNNCYEENLCEFRQEKNNGGNGNGKGRGDGTPKYDNCCRNVYPDGFELDEINDVGETVTSVYKRITQEEYNGI